MRKLKEAKNRSYIILYEEGEEEEDSYNDETTVINRKQARIFAARNECLPFEELFLLLNYCASFAQQVAAAIFLPSFLVRTESDIQTLLFSSPSLSFLPKQTRLY